MDFKDSKRLFLKFESCRIIRIRGGSHFVDFVGIPHPRIYILNEKKVNCLLNTWRLKEMVCNTPYCINKQTSMYRNNNPIFWSCGWFKYFMILSTSPDYSIQHLFGTVSHKFVTMDTLWNVTRWHERLNVMISWNNNARNALFNSPDSKGVQVVQTQAMFFSKRGYLGNRK